ncbi:AAA family ATPase [Tsukamurella soli]|uniref:AAA domain-containing protein n=1 Tax=Tsukamurella soli TaxID=644556 RepID=A0ABP8J8Y8_9ACTN
MQAGANSPVLVVTGAAGSGKSTLGRALARALRAPLIDLDSMTNPLLDELGPALGSEHWNSPGPMSERIRRGRYASLRAAASDLVSVGQRPVLVAPFTRELAGGDEWAALMGSVWPREVRVVYLTGPATVFEQRRRQRGAERDRHRVAATSPDRRPAIPHLELDATTGTDELVDLVLAAFEAG